MHKGWWAKDDIEHETGSLLLPRFITPASETDVVPKPSISSLVFVFYHSHVSCFQFCYIHGMSILCVTAWSLQFFLLWESIPYIVYDCISRVSSELQWVMTKERGNQMMYSSSSVQISLLAWMYLVQKLEVRVHRNSKVCTLSMMQSNDGSIVKMKCRVPC